MTVDVGFNGNKGVDEPVARPRAYAVNLSEDAMREHVKMAEYRNLACKLRADLDAAMASLATANAEIDRLTDENLRLAKELEAEKAKNDRIQTSVKGPKKGKKDAEPSEPSEPSQQQ